MKKVIGLLLALIMMASVMSFAVLAEDAGADVYLTLSDNTGKCVLVQEKITVTDIDQNGKYNIDEAFIAAHEAKVEGGAAAGYDNSLGYITKFWGVSTSAIGYYLNNTYVSTGFSEEIKAGDYLNVYFYQDTATYADTYAYFDRFTASVTEGDSLSLLLKQVTFDPTYSPVYEPLADAVITVDGEETSYKTDAEGKVTLPIEKAGELLIGAKKSGTVLVPPIVKVTAAEKPLVQQTPVTTTGTTSEVAGASETATEKSDKTGDSSVMIFGLLILFGFVTVLAGKKLYEA